MADFTIHCSAIHFLAVGACAQDLLDHVRECIGHYSHAIEQDNFYEVDSFQRILCGLSSNKADLSDYQSNCPGNAVLKILYNEVRIPTLSPCSIPRVSLRPRLFLM
jgi:hypothetical protein